MFRTIPYNEGLLISIGHPSRKHYCIFHSKYQACPTFLIETSHQCLCLSSGSGETAPGAWLVLPSSCPSPDPYPVRTEVPVFIFFSLENKSLQGRTNKQLSSYQLANIRIWRDDNRISPEGRGTCLWCHDAHLFLAMQ